MRNYIEARAGIRSGDLLAWTHRGWKSFNDLQIQLVRAVTRSEYSHVAIAYEMDGRLFAIEAVVPMVRIFPLSLLGDFYHIPIQANWSSDAAEFALSHVGESYSKWQAVTSLFRTLKNDKLWECAELAIAIASRSGVDLGNRSTPTAVVQAAMSQNSPCWYISNPGRPA